MTVPSPKGAIEKEQAALYMTRAELDYRADRSREDRLRLEETIRRLADVTVPRQEVEVRFSDMQRQLDDLKRRP